MDNPPLLILRSKTSMTMDLGVGIGARLITRLGNGIRLENQRFLLWNHDSTFGPCISICHLSQFIMFTSTVTTAGPVSVAGIRTLSNLLADSRAYGIFSLHFWNLTQPWNNPSRLLEGKSAVLEAQLDRTVGKYVEKYLYCILSILSA